MSTLASWFCCDVSVISIRTGRRTSVERWFLLSLSKKEFSRYCNWCFHFAFAWENFLCLPDLQRHCSLIYLWTGTMKLTLTYKKKNTLKDSFPRKRGLLQPEDWIILSRHMSQHVKKKHNIWKRCSTNCCRGILLDKANFHKDICLLPLKWQWQFDFQLRRTQEEIPETAGKKPLR